MHFTNSIFEDNNCQNSACVYYSVYSNYDSGNIIGSHFIRNRGARIIEYNSVYGTTLFSNNTMINNTINSPSTEAALYLNNRVTVNYNIFDNPDIIMQVKIVTCYQ
jgi:hypothetical protein